MIHNLDLLQKGSVLTLALGLGACCAHRPPPPPPQPIEVRCVIEHPPMHRQGPHRGWGPHHPGPHDGPPPPDGPQGFERREYPRPPHMYGPPAAPPANSKLSEALDEFKAACNHGLGPTHPDFQKLNSQCAVAKKKLDDAFNDAKKGKPREVSASPQAPSQADFAGGAERLKSARAAVGSVCNHGLSETHPDFEKADAPCRAARAEMAAAVANVATLNARKHGAETTAVEERP